MISVTEYFRAWKQRLMALKQAEYKIKLLSKEAQFMQALMVRNCCLDFNAELEKAFEEILADYIRRQDELFLAGVDEIHLMAFNKRPWPLDIDLSSEIAEQKKKLLADTKLLALQATEFEISVLMVMDNYKGEVYSIIGTLTTTYGVSPRLPKKR